MPVPLQADREPLISENENRGSGIKWEYNNKSAGIELLCNSKEQAIHISAWPIVYQRYDLYGVYSTWGVSPLQRQKHAQWFLFASCRVVSLDLFCGSLLPLAVVAWRKNTVVRANKGVLHRVVGILPRFIPFLLPGESRIGQDMDLSVLQHLN